MSNSTPRHLLAATIAALLTVAAVPGAHAQDARERAEARRAHKAEKEGAKATEEAAKYPQATRQAPDAKASAKMAPKLQKMMDLYQEDKAAEARAAADEIIAASNANAYDRSFAAQVAAQIAYGQDDSAAAQAYLKQAMDLNGLDNNGHYGAMYMLAQLQLQEDKYADALATLDKFLAETHSQDPEYLATKGNILYRMERYQEAVPVLKQAIAADTKGHNDWLQLLMGSYFEMDQPAEAARIAEELSAKSPNDKNLQMNLASIYIQADQNDKAVAVLEKLRTGGQLTEERDYSNLYKLYLNTEGKEKDAIAVINEGLQKGLLKPDYQTYSALAQAYYFSDQPGPAIDAYRKAAPLAPDGETYLNLAKALANEGRSAEAKQAAQQALDKGLRNPAEAKKLIGGK